MDSVFQWTRRRRLNAYCCKDSTLSSIEFSNFSCSCDSDSAYSNSAKPITEIILAGEIICVLQDGIGKALNRSTRQPICDLNSSPYCSIRSISYNHVNNTIILVWNSRVWNSGLSISILDPTKVKMVTKSTA